MDRPSRLTRRFVEQLAKPGRYGDGRGGNGLSLRVRPSRDGRGVYRSWEQRVVVKGKPTTVALGSYPAVNLTTAREKAAVNAQHIRAAFPRRSALDRLLGAVPAAALVMPGGSGAPAFKDVANDYIETQRAAWKPGSETETQTRRLLDRYALPTLGEIPVDAVTPAQVHDVLAPVWHTRPETGKKLRRVVRSIFTLAMSRGKCEVNPVERASLSLGRQKHVRQHSAALPYGQVAEAIAYVRSTRSFDGKKAAFEFLVLTATRTKEVLEMRRHEVGLGPDNCLMNPTWTIPGERMKSGRPHRVPLSLGAVRCLLEAYVIHIDDDALVFTDPKGSPVSLDGLRMLFQRGYPKFTVHGFRSSFRDWASEQTDYPAELAEHALAHLDSSQTRRAYARSDMFDKRRQLMADWGEYLRDTRPAQAG